MSHTEKVAAKYAAKHQWLVRSLARTTGDIDLIEDAAQSAWAILLARPDVDPETCDAWLWAVAMNEWRTLHNRRVRHAARTIDVEIERVSDPTTDDDREDRLDRLALMKHLRPREHRAVVLSALGYTCAQIAEEMGISYSRAYQILERGRQRVRAARDAQLGGEEAPR